MMGIRDNYQYIAFLAVLTFCISVCQSDEASTIDRPIRVTTIRLAPFLMVEDDPYATKNSDSTNYHGYIVDLLHILANIIEFNYTIKEVDDSKWGTAVNDTATSWSGMVGELISGKADLAAAPLTVSYDREKVVDFSMPFMTHGIAMIMHKKDVFPLERSVYQNLGFFLKPLSFAVWTATIICAVLVGLLLSINNYYNPYELAHRAQRGEDVPKDATHMFSLSQSLWFSFSSLFLQAFGVRPRSAAGRVLMIFWWFYSLIFVCTYVGAMVKTVPFIAPSVPRTARFRSLEDVVHQSNIKYGVVRSGAIRTFFENSDIPFYKLVAQNWTLVDSPEEGFRRMSEGGYAFITDSTLIDYMRSFNCDYLSVGEILDTRYYAFAVPHGSPLREKLNKVLLLLAENGHLDLLYHNYFQANFTYSAVGTSFFGHICQGTKISRETYTPLGRPAADPYYGHQVGLDVFGGPIILAILGVMFCVLALVCEKMYFKFRGQARSGVRSLRNRHSPYDDTTTEIVDEITTVT
ncbi:glutamate receptor ionotropic, kainate 3-like [Tubulanus polymorphus]|uniref:glutamate receptor ionotropic, kainate 3-like n=1 Tax=Tubulanus polymorphus TaxID=672921 RepID=UPI003DA53DF9